MLGVVQIFAFILYYHKLGTKNLFRRRENVNLYTGIVNNIAQLQCILTIFSIIMIDGSGKTDLITTIDHNTSSNLFSIQISNLIYNHLLYQSNLISKQFLNLISDRICKLISNLISNLSSAPIESVSSSLI